tara:strand:- start:87 stop:383 length:297 start_codon:yes stop_codon:yes gene_type:complete
LTYKLAQGGFTPPLFYVKITRYPIKRSRPMPQFTLICTDEDSTVTTKEFDATMLQEVVEKTQDFLKGVGYCFEELGVQVYPVASEDDELRSLYNNTDA